MVNITKCNNFFTNLAKTIFTFLIFIFVISIQVFANRVKNIDVNVIVNDDGSAHIEQIWSGQFNNGTENYIPISISDEVIDNLQVSMNEKIFISENNWNVNGSMSDKAYKCGINYVNKNQIELCFGISEYGNNIYKISYNINKLVRGYNDLDGFNYMFVNKNMSTFPTSVNWQLSLQNGKTLDSENSKIWAFGFNGKTEFNNGKAIAYTDYDLIDDNSFIVMMNFNKGIISPISKVDTSFETVKDLAFMDSQYSEYENQYDSNSDSGNSFLIIILLSFFIFGSTIFLSIFKIIKSINRTKELKKFYNDTNYFRDDPNGGNMQETYSLYMDFDIFHNNETNIIAALILKMIKDKCFEEVEEKQVGFFGREKVTMSLVLKKEPTDPACLELYNIISKAAGADQILQSQELEKYARKNYTVLSDFVNSLQSKGQRCLKIKGAYIKGGRRELKHLTDIGKKELSEMYGLRKYLDEFTLINEREIKEVEIWENYLIYATVFGIAKNVLKNLKDLYPDKLERFEEMEHMMDTSFVFYHSLYVNTNKGRQIALSKMTSEAVKGLGGASSFSGGGGFSGGGCGGGSR